MAIQTGAMIANPQVDPIEVMVPEIVGRGNRYFVHSGVGVDAYSGRLADTPLATLKAAIAKCVPNRGDRIVCLPGHNEGASAAIFDADIAGISIEGLGVGSLMPTFDFDNAAAAVDVGADNVTLKNLRFRPSVTSVLIGVHVETGVTGTVIEGCEFAIGEDGGGTDEFVKAIELTSGNHGTVIRNNRILAHASATHATHGIHIAAASDLLVIEGNVIDGPYATGGIVEAAAAVNHVVRGNSVDVTGTNLSFHASSTFADRRDNLIGGVSADFGATQVGTEFWVKKTLVSSAILTTGVDITGVSSGGELAIKNVVLKTDSTGLATGTNLTLGSNNAKGIGIFMTTAVSGLGASKTVDMQNASVSKNHTILETGKKLTAASTGAHCDGAGTIDVYILFQRLSAGATIAAA